MPISDEYQGEFASVRDARDHIASRKTAMMYRELPRTRQKRASFVSMPEQERRKLVTADRQGKNQCVFFGGSNLFEFEIGKKHGKVEVDAIQIWKECGSPKNGYDKRNFLKVVYDNGIPIVGQRKRYELLEYQRVPRTQKEFDFWLHFNKGIFCSTQGIYDENGKSMWHYAERSGKLEVPEKYKIVPLGHAWFTYYSDEGLNNRGDDWGAEHDGTFDFYEDMRQTLRHDNWIVFIA